MQVKVCPKCGVDNAPTYPVCRRCQAPLAGIAPTEMNPATDQPGGVTAPPQAPSRGPLTSYDSSEQPQEQAGIPVPPTGQPNPNFNRPPQTQRYVGPSIAEERKPEPKSSPAAMIFGFVMLAMVLGGVIFMWIKSNTPKPQPAVPADKVVMAFLQAKSTGDITKVTPYLTTASVNKLNKAFSGRQAESAGITRQDAHDLFLWGAPPTNEQIIGATIKAAVVKDKDTEELNGTRVHVAITTKMKILGPVQADVDFILFNEKNQWKIDLDETRRANTGLMQLFK